ncbi:response regulator [Solimonas marina]|uniref:Response regulator n=1 Tax=Solimonas marina TaxID=2714601 RepID=A0A970B860_9GAMM|nr:response regulator [Solimonas marina]NKF24395.1 response regulator [Solimonas marina]
MFCFVDVPLSFGIVMYIFGHRYRPIAKQAREGNAMHSNVGSGQKRRILVVDDDQECATALSQILEIVGHDARFVCEGAQATHAVDGFEPDIVLVDVSMPDIDGLEVARILRERDRPPLLVSISGFSENGVGAPRFSELFDHHLVKPIEFADLQTLIDTTAENSR